MTDAHEGEVRDWRPDEDDLADEPAAPPSGSFRTRRMTMSLPARVWDAMQNEVQQDDITLSEGLRRATWLYMFVRDRQRRGARMVFEYPGDAVSEHVVFPYP